MTLTGTSQWSQTWLCGLLQERRPLALVLLSHILLSSHPHSLTLCRLSPDHWPLPGWNAGPRPGAP
jgi:hypothetical protein